MNYIRNHGMKKRKPSEAEMQVFECLQAKGKKRLITEYRFDQSALSKFLDCFKTWILYNNTSISFACVEDEKLREGLAALGFPHGICRKTLCTTFLDTKYSEFISKRAQRLNYFKCFQIAADSWKSKYVNGSNKLVGVTLNFPDGCYLGDIFPTELGDTVSASYLLAKMTRLIDGLGPEYYIGCVFDGESAYQSAGRQLREKYPGSVHLTCQAHTLSLLLKQIERLEPDCFNTSHSMVKLCNEKDCKNVLHTFQKQAYGRTYQIRIGVETRFGYFVTEMKDLLKSKDAIMSMAGDQNIRRKYNANNPRATESQKTAFSNIDSSLFWSKLEILVKSLGPLVDIIEHIEQDKPMITQMFFVWRFLVHHFRVSELPIEDDHGGRIINNPHFGADLRTEPLSEDEKALAKAVKTRMSTTDTDIFTLAFLLDLRFYTQRGYNVFVPPVDRVGGKEIALAKTALKGLVPQVKQRDAVAEFEELMKTGIAVNPDLLLEPMQVLIQESRMPEQHEWRLAEGKLSTTYEVASMWRHIASFPILSDLACNLFAIHVTSCSVERLWSRMRALFKPTRSKLNPERAKKLMMISLGRDFDRNKKKLDKSAENRMITENNDTFMDELAQSEIDDLEWLQDVDLDLLPQDFVDLVGQSDQGFDLDRSESSRREGQTNLTSESAAINTPSL